MNRYYVYFIYLKNQLVYIGKGTNSRLSVTNLGNKYLSNVNPKLLVKVKRITEVTEKTALSLEAMYISKYQPIFNQRLNPSYSHSKAVKKLKELL
jgi:excinuclease UvrABC nuclease subunit